MNIEQITFIGTIMGLEATLLWQLFKLSKGIKYIMDKSGFSSEIKYSDSDKIDEILSILRNIHSKYL